MAFLRRKTSLNSGRAGTKTIYKPKSDTYTCTGDDAGSTIPIDATYVKVDAGGSARTGARFAGTGSAGQILYIENVGGLIINDPVKAAEAMAVLQSAQELFAPLNPTVNFAIGQDFCNKRDNMRANLKSRFSDLARYLDNHKGRYFIDDTPRAAEFACFHHLDLSRKLDPELLNEFPRLIKFVKDIENIEAVSKYLKYRPKLVDVGIQPKLIINGRAHPTGVNKT